MGGEQLIGVVKQWAASTKNTVSALWRVVYEAANVTQELTKSELTEGIKNWVALNESKAHRPLKRANRGGSTQGAPDSSENRASDAKKAKRGTGAEKHSLSEDTKVELERSNSLEQASRVKSTKPTTRQSGAMVQRGELKNESVAQREAAELNRDSDDDTTDDTDQDELVSVGSNAAMSGVLIAAAG